MKNLSPREHDVARRLCAGVPRKIIADQLGIAEDTVKFHLASIRRKLGAQNTNHAVALYTRQEIVNGRTDPVLPDLDGAILPG
jgi:DNA-binding CsgD family transcriptional regulator